MEEIIEKEIKKNGETFPKVGKIERGTVCLTITYRVPVRRKCIKVNDTFIEGDGKGQAFWDYKLLKSKLKNSIRKQHLIENFENDGDLDSTFDEDFN